MLGGFGIFATERTWSKALQDMIIGNYCQNKYFNFNEKDWRVWILLISWIIF